VLPFANRSANPDDVFFVDGIHDDLLTYIAQIGSLKTISRTSVMKYRDSTLSIPEIAGELGVATVLEGGVQRAGDQVRINVQLIDALTDDHLWSQIYDRQLTASNVFAIQSEIAESIAQALRTTLTSEEQARIRNVPTENLEALEAYFLGKQHMALRRQSDLIKAGEYFDRAVALDPEFALAWVGLADTWLLHSRGLSRADAFAESQAAAERALKLDPTLGEAYAADAKRRDWQGDLEGSEAAFRRALQLTPNYAPAYQWYGQMLQGQPGRIDEALAMHRRAIELDPQSAIIFNDYAGGLLAASQLDAALTNYRKSVSIEPRFTRGWWGIANVHVFYLGQLDEGLKAARSAVESNPDDWRGAASLGELYLDLGDPDQAAAWADAASARAPEGGVSELECLLHLYREDLDAAWTCAGNLLDSQPDSLVGLQLLRDRGMTTGDLGAVRSKFLEGFPELFVERLTSLDWRQRVISLDLAQLLLLMGDKPHAERLLDQAMSFAAADPRTPPGELAMHRVLTRAVRSDIAGATSALPPVEVSGWRHNTWYERRHSPLLEPLRNTPEYQAFSAELIAERTRQLARVREWEAGRELARKEN
jgi:TolB-like protein/tetratricopeptide (TPR) repeat protein